MLRYFEHIRSRPPLTIWLTLYFILNFTFLQDNNSPAHLTPSLILHFTMPDWQAKKFYRCLHNMEQAGLIVIVEQAPVPSQEGWTVVLIVNGLPFDGVGSSIRAARDVAALKALRVLGADTA